MIKLDSKLGIFLGISAIYTVMCGLAVLLFWPFVVGLVFWAVSEILIGLALANSREY